MLFMMFIQVKPLWQTFCIVLLFFFSQNFTKRNLNFLSERVNILFISSHVTVPDPELEMGGGGRENQFPKDFFLWAAVWSKIRGQHSPPGPSPESATVLSL